ncbi:MAG: hypothetical protein HYS26_01995 [Candidatus Kaiserbacteria bacterium]|nr:MAG: hypothetical protein HYS26_01995 [Candidatus Kaiserbacteria bacterium]
MAITSKKEEVVEGGAKKDALTVSFTNGALEQLESLKKFIGSDDPLEVVKVGIAFVQRAKEKQGEAHEPGPSKIQQK